MTLQFDQLTQALIRELEAALQQIDPVQLDHLHTAIQQAGRIFVAGKGRSGLQMRAFAMRLMHLGFSVYVVDDVTTPAITKDDLLIIGSGSGRTPSLVNYAHKCDVIGAKYCLLTANRESPMGEQAHGLVFLPAYTPKNADKSQSGSVLALASTFEQVLGLTLDLVIVQLRDDLNMNDADMMTRHANLE